jgi:hypothetical protein
VRVAVKKGERFRFSRSETQYRNPVNYAHLVEFGHRIVAGGTVARLSGRQAGKAAESRRTKTRGGGVVRGKRPGAFFLTRGWEASQAAIRSVVVATLREGVAREAAKAAARHRPKRIRMAGRAIGLSMKIGGL